jgi:4-amino-4-deoxy-L-arabinose transferase-like glycosyltransferase
MLIRPVSIGLPFLLALLLCFLKVAPLKKKILLGSVLVFLSFLPLLPWQVHVFNKTGQVSLLGTLGPAALRDGLTFGVLGKGFREGVEPPGDVRSLMTRIANRYPEMDTYSGALSVMKDEFAAAPIATIKLYFYKAARSWYATDSQRHETELFFLHLLYLSVFLLATVSLLRTGLKEFRKNLVVIVLICLYFWGMNLLGSTLARYMVPAFALIMIVIPGLIPILRRLESSDGFVLSERKPGQAMEGA